MMNKSAVRPISVVNVSVYFTYFEGLTGYRNSHRVYVCMCTCLKRFVTAAFESSEPFYMLRLMGMSATFLHIESTDSLIYLTSCGNISVMC